MDYLDYTYEFECISDKVKRGIVKRTNHAANEIRVIPIAVNDDLLPLKHFRSTPPLLADLTDIAASVYLADRLSKGVGDMPRHIKIRLPVRSPEILDRPEICHVLQKLLYRFTEDSWYFEFMPYTKAGRSSEISHCLPFTQEKIRPSYTVLWSGGLDSFAGVYQHLYRERAGHYTLFGTGGNDMIFHVQKETATTLEKLFPTRTKLVQLPLRLRGSSNMKKSSIARSRGFVFMLLGAVCAYQEGQNILYVYENGIGAINLPFRESEVGLDHTRSVHPLSLHYMSEFLSYLLEQPFWVQNPYLFWTKAQMCAEPLFNSASDAAFSTISCDSRHRKRPIQCGYCSSCLLRRQAIAAIGIADETGYQIMNRERKTSDCSYYYAMIAQVETIRELLSSRESWKRMSQKYTVLEDIVERLGEDKDMMKKQMLQLYQNYVIEWDKVKHIIEREFLE